MSRTSASHDLARRDPARSRQAILDAAERLFAERGYEAATMSEIGSEAGLSTGAPAYFFGSKEQLYRAVLGRAFDKTSALTRDWRLEAATFEDGVRDAVGSYIEFLGANPNFVKLVIRDALVGGRFLLGMPEHLAAIAEAMPRLGGAFARANLREEIDPAHLLLSGISLCWFPLVAVALTHNLGFQAGSRAFREARKEQVVELVLRGAMRRNLEDSE